MKTTQRILIVDDEESILFSYRKLLQNPGVQVDDCMTLEEALARIRDHDYNAIITDFRLSHSEGDEGLKILEYVRSHTPATPVIVLTGYGNDEIRDAALALGAYGYFDKPVQISMLINLLRQIGVHVGKS